LVTGQTHDVVELRRKNKQKYQRFWQKSL